MSSARSCASCGWISGTRYFQKNCIAFDVTSPSVSSTPAHTKAETKFATWNRQNGISKIPAISGTEAVRVGFANRAFGNTGIQYGLAGLRRGLVSPQQFVDLNTNLGGLDRCGAR